MDIRSLGDIVSREDSCPSVHEDATIFALSTLLSTARVDAVAVLSRTTSALAGIATSRDVAKCIARGEDVDTVKVSQIMTAHPITLPPTETPVKALALMREGGFRHIPVVARDNKKILGIVDVLSLAYDAITRLQVSYSTIPSRRGFEFMRAARETIEKPTLRPIVDRTAVATLTRDNSVLHACETLAREHLAAVVIVDENGLLDGIFTCQDVVHRVVVKRLNPITTSLEKVMTQNPDCAGPDFTLLESLQRMQACGFRHLPVVEDQTRLVVGLVDVLQLASDALDGFQSVTERATSKQPSQAAPSRPSAVRSFTSIITNLFCNLYAQREPIPQESSKGGPSAALHGGVGATSVGSSHVNHSQRKIQASSYQKPVALPSSRKHFSYISTDAAAAGRGNYTQGTVQLASFKFMDINKEYCRIKVPMSMDQGAFDQFVLDVRRRFAGTSIVGAIKIKYVDEDGDEVFISNDEDLASCFEDYFNSKTKTIQLKVYEVERPSSSQLQSPVSSAPSSAYGSPRLSLPSTVVKNDLPLAPKPEVPPTVPTASAPHTKSSGLMRRKSVQVIQTPSMLKASEAHQRMLDGKIDDAIMLFGDALKLNPGNARAKGGLGAARLFNGNSVGAEEEYRAAVALIESGRGGSVGDLTFQMCIVGLVESLIDQNRYEEAVVEAGKIDASSGNTGCADAFRDELDSAGNAAQEALEANEFGDAMNCYSNALRVEAAYLKLMPNEAARSSLRLGRAKCYKALDDFDMALEDYEVAIKLEPESVAGHKGSGKCLAELEQMDRALKAYERAHSLDPADEEINKEINIIKSMLPDPLDGKKAEIAKLGALLGSFNLPKS